MFQNLLHVLRKLLTHVSNFPIICWYASFSRILWIRSFLWMWMLLIPMGISCCSHCRPLLETAPFCIVMKLTNPLTERKDRPGKRYCKTMCWHKNNISTQCHVKDKWFTWMWQNIVLHSVFLYEVLFLFVFFRCFVKKKKKLK